LHNVIVRRASTPYSFGLVYNHVRPPKIIKRRRREVVDHSSEVPSQGLSGAIGPRKAAPRLVESRKSAAPLRLPKLLLVITITCGLDQRYQVIIHERRVAAQIGRQPQVMHGHEMQVDPMKVSQKCHLPSVSLICAHTFWGTRNKWRQTLRNIDATAITKWKCSHDKIKSRADKYLAMAVPERTR